MRPTFLFLLQEKKKCGAQRYKEKENVERLSLRKPLLLFLLHVLKQDSLVPCGLVSPLAPLTLTGAGRGRFLLFGIESISF